jgi:tetratricopeptide (TPR) repeat protein
MRPALLAALLACAPAWGFWGSGGDTIKELQKQFGAGRYDAVIAALDSDGLLKLRGDNLRRGYALLAASYEVTGRLDKSLSVYQVAVGLFPRDRDLLERLAMLMHRSGLNEQAKPLYEKLVRLDPDNANGHVGLAQIEHSLGFLDRSADHYEKGLQGFPKNGVLWREYGEELTDARDYRTAELALRRALELLPEDRAARLSLALALRAQGRSDEALAELDEFVRAGEPEALRARALWLMEEGRAAEGGAAAEALLRLSPNDPLGLYVRARLELKAGRRGGAQSSLRHAALQGEAAPFTAKICAALADLVGGGR